MTRAQDAPLKGLPIQLQGCVHLAFEQRAALHPDLPAVVSGDDQLTYGELEAQSTRLAHELVRLGVGPDTLVVVSLRRSLRFVVAVLAIHKAGGAYLPVDPSFPPERVDFVLRDSGTPIVLCENGTSPRPSPSGPRILSFDEPYWETQTQFTAPPPLLAKPHHLAYVLYTSGSTGQPKGVLIEHRGLTNLFRSTARILGTPADAKWLASSNFSFDISIQEFYWPLCHGQTVVIFRGDDSGECISDLILRHQITHLQGTPSRAQLLLEEPNAPKALAHLHQLLLAGEALVPELIARLQQHLHGGLFNLYGPTETTIYSVGTRIDDASAPVPIGLPMDNTDLLIVDETLQEVSPGEKGELLIGGVGLGRGYLNRPELTASRFIPHPKDPQSRAYRTGDLVRLRPDGMLDYLGRLDHQVKIRGYRIELGEIESRLCDVPSVHQAAVVAVPTPGGSLELVAYVTPRGTDSPTFGELRTFLRTRLPEYFVPGRFILLSEMPMTGSGKTDRKALASARGTLLEPAASEAPRTPLEQTLVQLWQSALGWNRIGIHDDFFQLGGHSLLAMRIAASLRRDLGRSIPWSTFFRHRTIAQLAEALSHPDDGSGAAAMNRLAPEVTEGPLSQTQAQICFLHQISRLPATYNVSFAYRLVGELDLERLLSAWREIIQQHEILRTAIVEVAGELRQRIIPIPVPPIECVDLSTFDEAMRASESARLIESVVRQAFDLSVAPLWRIQVQRLAPRETVLVLAFQHALVDEWTLRLLFEELAARLAPEPHSSDPTSTSPLRYLDFAAWQQREQLGPATARAREFWRETLADAPTDPHLPADFPRPSPSTFRGGQVVLSVHPRTRAAAEALARQQGCSTFMLGIAAFDLVLARLTGQHDQILGTPMSLRDRPEFQNIAGLFLNLIPVRLRIDPSARFTDWLRNVREAVLASFAHGTLPSPEIVRASGLNTDPGESPLFRILFIHLNEPWPAPRLPGIRVESIPVHTGTAKADLAFFLTDDGAGGWRCEWEFSEDRFRQATVAGFAQDFCRTLDALVRHPDQPVSTWLTQEPTGGTAAVDTFNPPPSAYPRDSTLGEIFAQAARTHPHREALLGEGQVWTYAELHAASDRRARCLQRLGVTRGTPVGLHLERSTEFVLNALSVVKAGGFYVPLAPDQPPARLRQLAADLSLRYVISSENTTPETFGDAIQVLPSRSFASPTDPALDGTPDAVARPLDPAYVMHTSGSTGVPKGVVVPHRAILRLVHGTDYLPWSPELRFLHLAPTAFDASTLEIWGPLLHGGACVVHSERLPSFEGLERTLREQRISCLWLTASLFNQILDHRPQLLRGVAYILTGGEALSVPHIQKALAALPESHLINGYGPTEATTFTTTFPIPRDGSIDRAQNIPIGRPLANTRCHVLDAHRRPVAPGNPGELYIGGDALALGYWNRPDLTDSAFIPDPFDPTPGARLYRSGDRVRWRPDGNLEFLGRFDDQVKIRGFRIEPKEVEAVLQQCPGVGLVYVFARETASSRELVACFESTATTEAASDTLRSFAERQLPAHMLPRVWMPVPRFPLTPNGKTDHAALREQASKIGSRPVAAVAPRSPIESRLAEIWARVLGVPGVGVQDDFYALGGYSLLAMRLVFEIGQAFGVTLSIADVLKHRTIEALASLLSQTPSGERLIQGTGDGPVLFFIPGVAGVNYIPDAIGQRLAKAGRFCDALQYPGVNDAEEPKRSVPELAEAMIQRLRAVYPQGPVCLAGYSLGGSVAHEMARRMDAAGDPPVLVMLYDAATPNSVRPRKWLPALMALKQRLICDGPWAVFRLVRRRFLGKLRSQRDNLAAELGLKETTPAVTCTAAPKPANSKENLRKRVFDASFEAADAHKPGTYGGHVVLFRSTDPLGYGIFQECDPLNGWKPHVTGRLDREDIPGDHWVLFREPGVSVLADRTAHWLTFARKARSKATPQ